MALQFLVDTQLPPRLSVFLKSKHTTDYPKGHLFTDRMIKEIALKEERIIVTKDKDFFDLFMTHQSLPRVLLVELGNINNNDLLKIFEKNIEHIIKLFEQNAGLVLLNNEMIVDYPLKIWK